MVAWPDGVNQKAYGMSIDYEDNKVEIEFDSGKKRTYLKNSSPKKEFSFNLKFDDSGANSEFKKFLSWYDNVLSAAAVIRKVRALSGFIGFKGSAGGLLSVT